MSLFHEICRRFDMDDPDALAIAVAADLKLSARQREALFPLILAECERMERNRVRSTEWAALSTRATARTGGVPVDRTADIASLLRETFALGNGKRVAWATATVEDHQTRIDFLHGKEKGLRATIKRHKDAIDRIKAHGVTCLGEIPQDDISEGAA